MARGKNPEEDLIAEKQAKAKKEALLYAEMVYHYKLIAQAVGVTDDTLKAYRDDDPDFSEELEKARNLFIRKNMKKARPEFLLERLNPELFKERKETDLKGELGVGLSASQVEQLIQARARRSDT